MVCTVIGTVSGLGAVVDFSDMMILGMAFPNIIGLLIMSKEVKSDLREYWKDLKEGRIVKY
jgi:AGCS family alanine or glycine:cation symporter